MKNIDNALVDKKILKDIIENIEYNKSIISYYEKFTKEYKGNEYQIVLSNRTYAIKECNKLWLLDKYEVHKIKDVKSQNLCKDKFCANCKKVKQSARMARYVDELESHSDSLHHLTLTLPNVPGVELESTIKHMAKCFKALTRYFTGNLKIKDLDFSCWGYEGAVRSLEVTFKNDSYHPHYHVGLVISPGAIGKKTIINTYSFDYRKGIPELKRLFSEQEILIQKIWYLLVNKQKVTKDNIDNLEIGYSCAIDKFPKEQYSELFKYMTKGTDEEGSILSYSNFRTLYWALYRVKQIQGYGCLYRITDDVDLELYEALYNEFVEEIRKKESPATVLEKPQELILDTQYKIISRKSYFKYLRQL